LADAGTRTGDPGHLVSQRGVHGVGIPVLEGSIRDRPCPAINGAGARRMIGAKASFAEDGKADLSWSPAPTGSHTASRQGPRKPLTSVTKASSLSW
jgi:hypothetical protein